ncbi:DEAD/DEAH box helicase, partial [Adlercreutzia rubneri]|uniref:DEAD/DEAH box helicase n=1 Tax=Adlercreutzia rubneri TaxID=2916441 RepID=UPI0023B1F91A
QWEETARRDPDGLEVAIVKAIIGDRPLHPAQREILDRLRAGKSTFAVMATGRGKSLCFQTYAAFRALTDHAASLFIYPLRALIADQVFHLRASLE